jgi:hypothetical protein
MLVDTDETPLAEAKPVDATEGPRRRLWICLIMCAYALTAIMIGLSAKLTGPTPIASVATVIYIVFSPVVWVSLYWKIGDW